MVCLVAAQECLMCLPLDPGRLFCIRVININMKRKQKYEPPVILESLVIQLEAEILSSSVDEMIDENFTVETAGQEVVTISADQWTNSWE